MTSIKKYPHILIFTCIFLAFLTLFTSLAKADETTEQSLQALAPKLPYLSVQAKQDPTYISPYMRYAFNLPVQDAQSVYARKDEFTPYDNLQLERKLGTYWFLLSFSPVQDKQISAAYLDIGNFLTKESKILILPKNSKTWQLLDDVYTREKLTGSNTPKSELGSIEEKSEISMFSSGLYDLTALRDGGELLIYSPGAPSIWFSPTLTLPAKASVTVDRRIAPFILISLVLLMVFSLWRGLREEGDARLWATLLTLFALIQYIWGVPQNTDGALRIWDTIGIISAACALFLLPHIGRHYMVTEKNAPNLDGFLQFLALPAIFPLAIIFVPIPEYFSIIRFAPLWGIYAFLPLIFCLPLALKGRKGALFYVFFCFSIGTGALLSLAFRFDSAWHLAPLAGLTCAMIAMFLAPRQTERNVYEKTYIDDADSLSDFAENNIPMREAFFRVEARLREPFDKILREACFLDFDIKAEDFAESVNILAEKKLGETYDKHTLNSIDDIAKRSERLRTHADFLVQACRDLSGMMGLMPQLAKKVTQQHPTHELFNLKNLVLTACDDIREEAQDKQVGLGWYIAPQMGLFYRGDKASLEIVIGLLLKDAVRATDKGMISIRVRRANNPNPGHIVFTISDSGKGKPPVQRSPLTLIKAWELSTNYNGQVELHSSPNGLSFSFSMECVAMDAQGLKPLSFASLDDIVLLSNEFDKGRAKQAAAYSSEGGKSGGNILFSKEKNGNPTQAVATMNPANYAVNAYEQNDEAYYMSVTENTKISILLISPLAIQRQNLAWYLNQYELWEALDVDSALAFYEKKPAMLVLVHSALSANGCNAVLAGIRLLEDSLGISPAPFVGLYQSAKDMEFLRLAGCKHLLPANIGREDLCAAVAEIMEDPFIAPIANIDAEHTVIRKTTKKELDAQNLTNQQAAQAVAKRLNIKRVHVGQVIDGAIVQENQTQKPQKTGYSSRPTKTAYSHNSQSTQDRQAPYQREVRREHLSEIIDDTVDYPYDDSTQSTPHHNHTSADATPSQHVQSQNNDTYTHNSHNAIYDDADLVKPPKSKTDTQNQSNTSGLIKENKDINPEAYTDKNQDSDTNSKNEDVQSVENQKNKTHQQDKSTLRSETPKHNREEKSKTALTEKHGFISKLLHAIRPKPYISLQEKNALSDDLVGEPMPVVSSTKNDSSDHNEYDTVDAYDDDINFSQDTNQEISETEADTLTSADNKDDTLTFASGEDDDTITDASIVQEVSEESLQFKNGSRTVEQWNQDELNHAQESLAADAEEANETDDDTSENFDEKASAHSDEDNNDSENDADDSNKNSESTDDDNNDNNDDNADTESTDNDNADDSLRFLGNIESPAHTDSNGGLVINISDSIEDEDSKEQESKTTGIDSHLSFLPSDTEDFVHANDEDIPIMSSLPRLNWDNESTQYQDIEKENTFSPSGLINTQDKMEDNHVSINWDLPESITSNITQFEKDNFPEDFTAFKGSHMPKDLSNADQASEATKNEEFEDVDDNNYDVDGKNTDDKNSIDDDSTHAEPSLGTSSNGSQEFPKESVTDEAVTDEAVTDEAVTDEAVITKDAQASVDGVETASTEMTTEDTPDTTATTATTSDAKNNADESSDLTETDGTAENDDIDYDDADSDAKNEEIDSQDSDSDSDDIDNEDAILNLTDDMLLISTEKEPQHPNDNIQKLKLELPAGNAKSRRKERKRKEKIQSKLDISLDLDIADFKAKTKDIEKSRTDKTMQLSFFPVDDTDK